MSNIFDECPVPILQSPWEFGQLYAKYRALLPKKIIEVGSFYGGTLWYWLKSKRIRRVYEGTDIEFPWKFGEEAELISVSSIDYPIGPSDGRYEEMIRCRAMWPEWTKGIEFHDLQGDSHSPEMIQKVRDIYPANDVDFLFIDGDHSYGGVKSDFENYAPLVRPGGLIVLHDVCGLPEVAKFWQEIKTQYKTIEINEPGGWGIGIIEK